MDSAEFLVSSADCQVLSEKMAEGFISSLYPTKRLHFFANQQINVSLVVISGFGIYLAFYRSECVLIENSKDK